MITDNKFTAKEFSETVRLFAQKLFDKINETQHVDIQVKETPGSAELTVIQPNGYLNTWIFDHLSDGTVETTRVLHANQN